MYFLGEWATEIYKRMVTMVELTSFCHSGSVRNCFIEYSSVLTFVLLYKNGKPGYGRIKRQNEEKETPL